MWPIVTSSEASAHRRSLAAAPHSTYVVWDRRTLKCVSHHDNEELGGMVIRNTPLTDVEKHQRHVRATEAVRTTYPKDDPRLEQLQRSALRER